MVAVARVRYARRRIHLLVRGYVLGGAALGRELGARGAKGWNCCVCINRQPVKEPFRKTESDRVLERTQRADRMYGDCSISRLKRDLHFAASKGQNRPHLWCLFFGLDDADIFGFLTKQKVRLRRIQQAASPAHIRKLSFHASTPLEPARLSSRNIFGTFGARRHLIYVPS